MCHQAIWNWPKFPAILVKASHWEPLSVSLLIKMVKYLVAGDWAAGAYIQNTLKEGVIEHTISPFNFPNPATNEWRLAVNYQNLNAQVPLLRLPFPVLSS